MKDLQNTKGGKLRPFPPLNDSRSSESKVTLNTSEFSSNRPNAQGDIRSAMQDLVEPSGHAWARAHWTGDRWQRVKLTGRMVESSFSGRALLSFEVSSTRVVIFDLDAHDTVESAARTHFAAMATTGGEWAWTKPMQRELVATLCAPVVDAMEQALGASLMRFRSERGLHAVLVLPSRQNVAEALQTTAALAEVIAKCETPDVSIEVFPKPSGERMRMCAFPGTGASRLLKDDCRGVQFRRRAEDIEAIRNADPIDLEMLDRWVGDEPRQIDLSCDDESRVDDEPRNAFSEEVRRLLVDGMPNDGSWVALRVLAAAFAFAGVEFEAACHRFAEYLEQVEHGSTRAQSQSGRAKLLDSFRWAMRKQIARLDRNEIQANLRGILGDVLHGRKDFACLRDCVLNRKSRSLRSRVERARANEQILEAQKHESKAKQVRRENGRRAASARLAKRSALRNCATKRRMTGARIVSLGMIAEKISVLVDNRIRIPRTSLTSEMVEKLKSEFTYDNPDYARAVRYQRFVGKGVPKTLQTWEEEDGDLTFARGSAKRVFQLLRSNGFDIAIKNATTEGGVGLWDFYPRTLAGVELWDHQKELVRTSIEKQNCLQRGGTGSGKTTAAIALAVELRLPTLVVVHSDALLKQWVARVSKELGISSSDVGIIQADVCRIKAITIGMAQTLRTRVHALRSVFGCVIQDEVQFAAAPTFFSVTDKLPAKYRIGISASEKRKDGKEFLIYDVFGDVVNETSYETLVGAGVLEDVEVRVVPTEFDAAWLRAARIANQRNRNHGAEQARLLDEMTEDEERNRLVFDLAKRELEIGARCVFFNKRREGCREILKALERSNFVGGLLLGKQCKADEDEFDRTRKGLASGELNFGVGTYQAMGTGVDIPALEVGVLMHPIANDEKGEPFFKQVRGRFCRKTEGKSRSLLYYVWDQKIYGKKPLRNLTKWCANVRVWRGGEWVDAKAVLKEKGNQKCEESGAK